MNASRKTEWLLMPTAIVSAAGGAANEPLVSLGAAALAALWLVRPARGLAHASASVPGCGRLDDRHRRATPVFLAFSGGEWLSPPPASETDAASDTDEEAQPAEKSDQDRGSKAYEEFAAGLEDDASEEISFLPPYASNDGRSGTGATQRRSGGPSGDSLLAGDLDDSEGPNRKMPVPRRFALGTVAIIRRLLEPSDVERILVEQRRYPRLRFGDVAVQLGLLTEDEVQELLVAQEQGIFSEQEITDARERLASYHNG